ncbi:hypothetical protein [Candidatus Epulonipiscium viviparus]|uniref:hypothetical protein n=1 Tax=Candidatus Epulonipiscium viviparus TaxID=420336 RepID=UPI00273812DB|nr:hypothetical protein [Candidatus Epulopiscium viviparus]
MIDDKYYLSALEITSQCRQEFIEGVLNSNPNIYSALYSDLESEIYYIRTKVYELEWLKSHYDEFLLQLKKFSSEDRPKFTTLFAEHLHRFANSWRDSSMSLNFVEEQLQALRTLINQNEEWETNLKKLQIKLIKENKILDRELKKLTQKEEIL